MGICACGGGRDQVAGRGSDHCDQHVRMEAVDDVSADALCGLMQDNGQCQRVRTSLIANRGKRIYARWRARPVDCDLAGSAKAMQRFTIEFGNAEMDVANRYAEDLADAIRELGEIRVERTRADATSQDLGSLLVLLLGTPSVTALAHGLAIWLRRNSGATIEITGPDGRSAVLKNVTSSDAPAILQRLINPHGE